MPPQALTHARPELPATSELLASDPARAGK
jgi:hypothetical protein